jgi:Flp pilus assembly pilin Flp
LLSRIIQSGVSLKNSDRGVTVVDYGLMVGLLAVVIIFAVALGLAA